MAPLLAKYNLVVIFVACSISKLDQYCFPLAVRVTQPWRVLFLAGNLAGEYYRYLAYNILRDCTALKKGESPATCPFYCLSKNCQTLWR